MKVTGTTRLPARQPINGSYEHAIGTDETTFLEVVPADLGGFGMASFTLDVTALEKNTGRIRVRVQFQGQWRLLKDVQVPASTEAIQVDLGLIGVPFRLSLLTSPAETAPRTIHYDGGLY